MAFTDMKTWSSPNFAIFTTSAENYVILGLYEQGSYLFGVGG